jgi:tetratricopeptide (TPR) repeat protein
MRRKKSRARQRNEQSVPAGPTHPAAAASASEGGDTENDTEDDVGAVPVTSATGSPIVDTPASTPDAPADTAVVEEGQVVNAEDEAPADDAADDAALDYWRQVVLREPSNVTARRHLARVHERRGNRLLAVEQLEAARTVQPENVDLIVELANAQIVLKQFDAAERDLRRTLRFQSDHADVHLALGVISFRRGLYAQAEQELRRALELDAESANAYFYRGEALNQLSRVDEALDMLLRATQLQPANARAYYVMGILYDKKSRPQEAAAMYRKAREASAA